MLRRRLVPVLAACALALTACASPQTAEEPPPTPTHEASPTETEDISVLVDAARATAEQGTAAFRVITYAEGEAPPDVTGDATGDDTAAGVLRIDGEADFESEQRRLTFHGPQGTLEMLVDGQDVYIELPATEDEQWIRLQADRLGPGALDLTGPVALPVQDPEVGLAFLQGAAGELGVVGEEDIDGTATTHYRTTIDVQAAVSDADPAVREDLEATAEAIGLEEVDMEVWVDDDEGLIRQVRYTVSPATTVEDLGEGATGDTSPGTDATAGMDATAGTDATTGSGTATGDDTVSAMVVVQMTYTDFGQPVDITLPDDDAVIDLDEQAVREAFGAGGTAGTGGTGGTTGAGGTTGTGGATTGTDATDDDASPSPSPDGGDDEDDDAPGATASPSPTS